MTAAPALHECPGPLCTTQVRRDRLTCPPCWRKVPAPLRAAVWAAWGRHGEGAGSPAHRAAVDAAIRSLGRLGARG